MKGKMFLIIVLCLVALIGIIGCCDDDDDEGNGTTAPTTAEPVHDGKCHLGLPWTPPEGAWERKYDRGTFWQIYQDGTVNCVKVATWNEEKTMVIPKAVQEGYYDSTTKLPNVTFEDYELYQADQIFEYGDGGLWPTFYAGWAKTIW